MDHSVALLLLVGGWGSSDVELALRGAHEAAARDLLDALLSTNCLARVIVATDDAAWAKTLADLPATVDVDPPGEPFHFGRRLAGLIERYQVERALYVGGASAPLLPAAAWAGLLERLARADRWVVTNNLHSSDWVGFAPAGEVVSLIAAQGHDNALAWMLGHDLGWPVQSSPPSAATRFDLDTPVDLLIARAHAGIGPRLRRYLDELAWDGSRVERLLEAMGVEGGSLVVAGRASSAAWAMLEQATACWVRVYAEERGMRASGRQAAGRVRSLLADYLDLAGIEGFFDELGQLAAGILLDNRVILAARSLWPSAQDRFNSDLLRWEEIGEPFLRRFTQAAASARVPVVMGGHSVVAGGLMALVEVHRARGGGS